MTTFHNRTRRSVSIPQRLRLEGRAYLIPLYHVVRMSDLAREAIDHSGSYRFSDHIYAARPSGRNAVGWLLDSVFLCLKSARALRSRYGFAVAELRRFIEQRIREGRTGPGIRGAHSIDVLTVPCGLARELFELAGDDEIGGQVRLHGMDLDAELVDTLKRRALQNDSPPKFYAGDALDPDSYPGCFDVILSMGLTEFLSDEQTVQFYQTIRRRLKPGGIMVTSGLDRHPPTDFLLRNLAELNTNYRTEATLRELAARVGFRHISSYRDRHGLQTMLIAGDD